MIGAGVSGLVAARLLDARHAVTVFDANDYAGGHTRTLDVLHEGRRTAVDIGFIVFNARTYPRFCALLDELGVTSRPSSMGFSVSDVRTGLEYMGGTLDGLFAQRRNLLRPAFYRMLRDIARFFADGKRALADGEASGSLGEFLERGRYGEDCVQRFVVPMAAAIWSTDPARVMAFPAHFFLRFFANHGLLDLRDRPQWRVVEGGSRTYVERLLADFGGTLRLSTPVLRVQRAPDGVTVTTARDGPQRFDAAVLACHSDQALAMLADPDADERRVLGAIDYVDNEVVLHTDTALLPSRRRAWAAWNYRLGTRQRGAATLTYNMNILQGLDNRSPLCVTLNDTARIDPRRILHVTTMAHPLYTPEAVAAQNAAAAINGGRRTFYCGAYWGNGFHEDGVASAHAAVAALESDIAHEKLSVHRADRAPAALAGAQRL